MSLFELSCMEMTAGLGFTSWTVLNYIEDIGTTFIVVICGNITWLMVFSVAWHVVSPFVMGLILLYMLITIATN